MSIQIDNLHVFRQRKANNSKLHGEFLLESIAKNLHEEMIDLIAYFRKKQ
jgi:hypothetical protein